MDKNQGRWLALAAFILGLAGIPLGFRVGAYVLVAVAVAIAFVTFAPTIPGARRLPLIAAPLVALDATFDPDDPGCRQVRAAQHDVQLRLRVTNTGQVVLTGVRCRLRSRHDHIGRIRHDNTPPYTRSLDGVTLQVGDTDYFDVAFCRVDGPQMVVQYADDYLVNEQVPNARKAQRTPVRCAIEVCRGDTGNSIPRVALDYTVVPRLMAGLRWC